MTPGPGSWRQRLTLVLATLIVAGTGVLAVPQMASAATLPAAGTHVGATTIPAPAVVGSDAGVWASQHQVDGPPLVGLVVATGVAAKAATWDLPAAGGGLRIGGRWLTEHALERMAPNTPEVMAIFERRALARAEAAGLSSGTPEFGAWWAMNGLDPRNVPPMVVEAEIASPGSMGVHVITNASGDVVTVIPR